jgi:hypothetical protein
VKSVVLDSTELSSDFLCAGLKFQLLDHMFHETWLSVYVPASVFEETVANHERRTIVLQTATTKLSEDRRRHGLGGMGNAEEEGFEYRSYLADRLEELGITVLPWPDVTHQELVARAVSRTPPFDEKGGGYRDSLVWADAVQLAASGGQVALVSGDKAFAGLDGTLAPALQEEVADLDGSIELVRDFRSWLVAELPWEERDLGSAVAASRDRQFYDYFVKSDVRDDLAPEIEDLGLRRAPEEFRITEAEWDGGFEPVRSAPGSDGRTLVEYAVGFEVVFDAEYAEMTETESGWEVREDALLRTHVSGTVLMTAGITVLFPGDLGEFEIVDVSWRRADGLGKGASLLEPEGGPDQPSLLDLRAVST